jgi:hypothetical protein
MPVSEKQEPARVFSAFGKHCCQPNFSLQGRSHAPVNFYTIIKQACIIRFNQQGDFFADRRFFGDIQQVIIHESFSGFLDMMSKLSFSIFVTGVCCAKEAA